MLYEVKEDDIVKGLNVGAEDYITKPFSTKELLARVNRILLRSKKKSIIKIKDVSFDIRTPIVNANVSYIASYKDIRLALNLLRKTSPNSVEYFTSKYKILYYDNNI